MTKLDRVISVLAVTEKEKAISFGHSATDIAQSIHVTTGGSAVLSCSYWAKYVLNAREL